MCLTLTGLPSIEIRSVIDACNFITIDWITTADPVCGDVIYTVRSLDNGAVVMMNTTKDTTYNFTGLNEFVNYSINVTATNNAGDSEAVTVQTGLSIPPIVILRQSMYDHVKRSCTVHSVGTLHVHIIRTYV